MINDFFDRYRLTLISFLLILILAGVLVTGGLITCNRSGATGSGWLKCYNITVVDVCESEKGGYYLINNSLSVNNTG